MDMQKLAAEAAVAAVKELTTTGVKAGAAGAGKLWSWIRGKAPAADATALASVEAEPGKPSATDKVTGLLKDLLHDRPELQAELAELLAKVRAEQGASQVAVASGGSKVAQVSGHKNRTDIR